MNKKEKQELIDWIQRHVSTPLGLPNVSKMVRVKELIEKINKLDEPRITDEQAWNKVAEAYPESPQSLRNTLDNAVFGKAGEPQKPVVPKFVAEWIELCKEKADLISCLSGSYEYGVNHYKRITEDEDWSFESDHQEIVAQAWLNGYEVEKEPLYCVKVGKGYFSGFDETKVTYVLDDAPGSLARRVTYKDKDEAEMDAAQIGGTVEEVAEE